MKKLLVFAALICSCAKLYTASSEARENQFVIELDGNRTTGYSWTYTMEPDGVVREVSSEYRNSGTRNSAGAGGVFVFVFESVNPGSATLRFSYARPWESGVEPAKNMSYTLTVDSSGKINVVSEQVK
ncbi:MAG: protease inhibitor I42 family protein [Spirochaetaceae bacterium]|jgi:inhibitor of cysteine peptidase|nr:protease inhibitor I42 family protein [Spirochaetaceae bacterium]